MTQIKPLSSMETPRFADVATFFRLPIIKDLNKLDYCVAGVPWDGGVTDAVIDSKTGWCVDPMNEENLANVLKEAINNKNLRQKYGLQAEKNFLKSFLGEKVFRKFMDAISI